MSEWRFPDLEKVIAAYLRGYLGCEVSDEVPPDVESRLPFVRVTRGPGSDDTVTDSPLLDLDCLAGDRGAAVTLSEDVREAMHHVASRTADNSLIDNVTTAVGPTYLAWSPTIARYVASYRVELRGAPTD